MIKFLSLWTITYFIDQFHFFALLATFMFTILKKKKHKHLRYISFYLGAFALMAVSSRILDFWKYDAHLKTIQTAILAYGNYVVSLIEYFAMYYLVYHAVKLKKSKKAVSIAGIISGIVLFAYSISVFSETSERLITILNNFFIPDLLFLFTLCVIFFVDLLLSHSEENLINRSDFWIVTGLTFYSISTLPYSLLINSFIFVDYTLYQNVFSLVYLFYILFFGTIIKAFTCNQEN